MRVIIMQGIPGSGKSTYISRTRKPGDVVFSADHYFFGQAGGWGYNFDPRKLPEAHQKCLRGFLSRVRHSLPSSGDIFVDNTNIHAWEIAPYYSAAEAFGAEVKIVRLVCTSVGVAARRNIHGVPVDVVERMARDLLLRGSLPRHWKVEEVSAG